MRRTNNDHSETLRESKGTATRKRSRTKDASSKLRTSKQRLCYGLMTGIVIWQGLIFPWLTQSSLSTSSQESSQAEKISSLRRSSPHATQKPDGTFNKYPVYRQSKPFHSTVHCVGETHDPKTSWMYRSCEFTNLCLNVQDKEFYLVNSPMEVKLQEKRVPLSYFSTEVTPNATNLTLALGGINPRWQGNDFNQGIDKVKWFPKRMQQPPNNYYMLDDDVVLVPFHSFAAHNVGHLLWDDFLPIFTLLQMFGYLGNGDDNMQQLLLRVDTLPLLYGTCEMRRKKLKRCASNFEKFLPLFGVDPGTFTTVKTVNFESQLEAESPSSSMFVCAKHAVAGLGMLTDHGLKDHGWLMPKENYAHNTAKGPLLYQFRNYLLRNLNLPTRSTTSKVNIILSAHSSSDPDRDKHFVNQQHVLSQTFPDAHVQTVELANLGLREQMELVSQTQVFVTTCGGGAMTATVLPKGATLILYYNEKGGYDFAHDFNLTGDPVFLDWDIFNNMAHLRVHWLPIGTMQSNEGLQTLMFLIRHELDVMSNGI